MSLITEKLTSATLRLQTADKIRSGILNGCLLPGERLVEREVAEQRGISLTVVREALVQLETVGSVTKCPNPSTDITELALSEIEQILAVRRLRAFDIAFDACCSRLRRLNPTQQPKSQSNRRATLQVRWQ